MVFFLCWNQRRVPCHRRLFEAVRCLSAGGGAAGTLSALFPRDGVLLLLVSILAFDAVGLLLHKGWFPEGIRSPCHDPDHPAGGFAVSLLPDAAVLLQRDDQPDRRDSAGDLLDS